VGIAFTPVSGFRHDEAAMQHPNTSFHIVGEIEIGDYKGEESVTATLK
jgi:hypothetical protein